MGALIGDEDRQKRVEFGIRLKKMIAQKHGTITQFLKAAYGRDEHGKIRGAGYVYPMLQGVRWPSFTQSAILKKSLQLTDDEWISLVGKDLTVSDEDRPKRINNRNPPPMAEKPVPAFSFVIQSDGLAGVSLEVSGIPVEKAMALLAFLSNEKIVSTNKREPDDA